MKTKFIKEARIFLKSTAASLFIGALAFLFFEILIRAGISAAISSVISTVFLSILGVPLLKKSFESDTDLKSTYVRYGVLASIYTLIIYLTFPSFNVFFSNIFHVSDLLSLAGLKLIYYPLYYIIAKYYIFK